MTFDKNNSRIAITVPFFRLLRSQDGLFDKNQRANEPYLVTLAIDSNSKESPSIAFNSSPFPNVRRGEKVEMLGDGHLVYGPENPGEFVVVSILLMESDNEYRELGTKLETAIKDSAVDAGLKALMTANATAGAIGQGLQLATGLVARILKGNRDDEVIRTAGTFFRDRPVPYDINRQFTRGNKEAEIAVKVIALSESNGQGSAPKCVTL